MGAAPHSAAAPEGKNWRATLADLGLLAALPAAFALTSWAFGAGAVAVVFLVGRRTPGVRLMLVAVATWLTLVCASVVAALTLLGGCEHKPLRWTAVLVVAGTGVVYFAIGLLSLRTRQLWGLPLAVALACLVGVTLWHVLPGSGDPTACFH
jgi:hypothetical protein